MRKIRLDVTALRVESFEAVDEKSRERGTVYGHITRALDTCPQTQPPTGCGQECLSGWRPCQPTDAWTDGVRMCYCGGSGQFAC